VLEVSHCLQAQALFAFALEAPFQRRVEAACALPRIALQSGQDARRYRRSILEVTLPDLFDRQLVYACHSV
jgi:hypothetical protein